MGTAAIDQNSAKYISNVLEYVEITYGKDELEKMLINGELKRYAEEYNKRYEEFVHKVLYNSTGQKEFIFKEMAKVTYEKINRRKAKAPDSK